MPRHLARSAPTLLLALAAALVATRVGVARGQDATQVEYDRLRFELPGEWQVQEPSEQLAFVTQDGRSGLLLWRAVDPGTGGGLRQLLVGLRDRLEEGRRPVPAQCWDEPRLGYCRSGLPFGALLWASRGEDGPRLSMFLAFTVGARLQAGALMASDAESFRALLAVVPEALEGARAVLPAGEPRPLQGARLPHAFFNVAFEVPAGWRAEDSDHPNQARWEVDVPLGRFCPQRVEVRVAGPGDAVPERAAPPGEAALTEGLEGAQVIERGYWGAHDVGVGAVFRLPEGQGTEVELRFEHSLGDVDLSIVDAQGREIVSSDGVGDVESVRVNVPRGSVSYAVIERVLPDMSVSVCLELQRAAPASPQQVLSHLLLERAELGLDRVEGAQLQRAGLEEGRLGDSDYVGLVLHEQVQEGWRVRRTGAVVMSPHGALLLVTGVGQGLEGWRRPTPRQRQALVSWYSEQVEGRLLGLLASVEWRPEAVVRRPDLERFLLAQGRFHYYDSSISSFGDTMASFTHRIDWTFQEGNVVVMDEESSANATTTFYDMGGHWDGYSTAASEEESGPQRARFEVWAAAEGQPAAGTTWIVVTHPSAHSTFHPLQVREGGGFSIDGRRHDPE